MNNINPMNTRFQIILSIVSCILLGIVYFLLQPRLSNKIPFIREYRLNQFIQNSIKNNAISAQEFWQLREFYSSGVIQFNKPSVLFTSEKITSKETLVDKNKYLSLLLPEDNKWTVIYKKENELIARNGETTYVYFIKPISEMSQANGFFDYKDKDKKLLEDKKWFVYTIIKK